jgi:hypothetical protein
MVLFQGFQFRVLFNSSEYDVVDQPMIEFVENMGFSNLEEETMERIVDDLIGQGVLPNDKSYEGYIITLPDGTSPEVQSYVILE